LNVENGVKRINIQPLSGLGAIFRSSLSPDCIGGYSPSTTSWLLIAKLTTLLLKRHPHYSRSEIKWTNDKTAGIGENDTGLVFKVRLPEQNLRHISRGRCSETIGAAPYFFEKN
jgi:hypothetical protein